MTTFEQGMKLVLDYEGRVFENDPNDPGSDTKYGISRKSYPNFDIRNLTEGVAIELYRRDFWTPIMGEQLPPKLAIAVLDCAVNQGLKTAIKMLQGMLDLEADGVMGPRTLEAAAKTTDLDVAHYLLIRAKYYMGLKKLIGVFGPNWGLRLTKLHEALFPKEARQHEITQA